MKYNKPELLAPAGSFEKMQYAFMYGADAVYAGIPMFSLRARENRFSIDEVRKAVEYAHNLNKKIYLTANIYAHNHKIESFIEAFDEMIKLRPDGFIMSDPGLIMIVREKYPKSVIHLSTQANNVNYAQARFWKKYLGVERIILARELSIKEIAEIHKKVPDIELEAFVHGAICMSYSGRCLISNYLTGRDSNQGICSHSCRWKYRLYKEEEGEFLREKGSNIQGKYYLEEQERPGEFLPIDEDEHGTYILNSRDMCAINVLEDLVRAGVISLKIEGRSKTLNYLCTTVKVYREAIDKVCDGKKIPDELINELASISSRGFIPGFFKGSIDSIDYTGMSYQTHQSIGIIRNFDNANKVIDIEMKNRVSKGDEIEIYGPNEIFTQKVKEMWYTDDSEKEMLDTVHGGHKNVSMKIDKQISDFYLIRKKIG